MKLGTHGFEYSPPATTSTELCCQSKPQALSPTAGSLTQARVQDLPDAAFEDAQSPVPALQGLLKTLAALEPRDQWQLLRHHSVHSACTAARQSLHRIPEQVLLEWRLRRTS